MSKTKRRYGNIDVTDEREGTNTIRIIEPRWHDRTVLVADWKLAPVNYVVIEHKDFPEPFYLTAERARQFPIQQIETKQGHMVNMRVIPLEALSKEVI